MDITTDVFRSGGALIEQFAFVAGKTFSEALLQSARGAVRYAIAITPPATAQAGAGSLDSGSEAKVRGYKAISRDLNSLFAPVRLKHKRKERISAAQMVNIHRLRLSKKRPGSPMTRGRAQAYYVDVRKFNDYEKTLRSHVGRLASGWLPSVEALSVKGTPAWITRHGTGRGSVQIQLSGQSLFVRAVNEPSPHMPTKIVADTQRRMGYAVQYALNDLKRQIPVLLERAGGSIGILGR